LSGLACAAAWVKRLPVDPRNSESAAWPGGKKTCRCIAIRHFLAQKAAHYNQRSVLRGRRGL